MTLRGGTDSVPVPSWMTANAAHFDNLNQGNTHGRTGCERQTA